MTNAEQSLENAGQIRSRRSVLSRMVRWFIGICLTLAILAGLLLGGLYWRLKQGPLSFPGLSDRVIAGMSTYFASDLKISLIKSALELNDGSFALRIRGLEMLNNERQVQLRAPDTVVSVDTLSLLLGRLHPRMIEFIDLQVIGTVNEDGTITFVPEGRGGAPDPVEAQQALATQPAVSAGAEQSQSRLSRGVEAFLNMIAGTDGPLGVLDRARFTNLRLTLVDVARDMRTHFSRIDVNFERAPGGGRNFQAQLVGLQGPWSLKGEVIPRASGYRTAFSIEQAPLQDVLVLSGLSMVPATTTLVLSGQADLELADGVLGFFNGSFSTGEGRIDVHDPDATPLLVNSSVFNLNWDEKKQQVNITQLEFVASGGTHFRMVGDASMRPGQPWTLNLSADKATLSGVTTADKPVAIDRFEGTFDGSKSKVQGRLLFKGPALDADVTVQIGTESDAGAVAVDAKVKGTAVRSVLRLWPEVVASAPRRYLLSSLHGGTAEDGFVRVRMAGDLIGEAMNGGALPEDALLVDVAVANAEMTPTAGLPALAKMAVDVKVTGIGAAVSGRNAVITLPDGRSLRLPTVSFNMKDFWPKDTVGIIAADIEGSADAVTSFLHLPKIREAVKWNINPDDIKGKAILKLGIDLPVRNIPRLVDLPISVKGRLSEVTLNNVAGTEKLEKGNFGIDYNRGALTLKGEGQLAGAPATISVSQQAGGEGAGVFVFSLDEAARIRKGMDFGSQLTGALPVKVTLALGKSASDRYQVEADLSKVAINNLLPGWTKAAGRPGKLTLLAVKTENGLDIKDLVLESGTVRMAGHARLSKEGGFESADLASFQLSQGDDMQVKLDKAGDAYRAVIRGNLGDVRPIIRSFTDTSGNGQRTSRSGGSGPNFDVDAALNIMTGFNDEALTKTSLKASFRNNTLRQFSLSGRLGSAPVTVQTMPKGNNTILSVHSDNAGSFLRFLDIYRRMTGGDLFLETGLGEGAQSGFAMARNFVIRNEPALRRIIPTQTQGVGKQRIDVNDAPFTKARVDFARAGGRLEFRDAAIWGSHVGFTLEGYLDFPRNRLDVSGTFVPAYGLNNAFAQVPLFGQILGGGQYGGLFGVNLVMFAR